ncbi:MAG: hypothetical protein QXG00_01615 [Candidatus Woesearchaeota archaeon]
MSLEDKVNQDFFSEINIETSYVLGILFNSCLPRGFLGIVIRSRQRDLIELVNKKLGITYKIFTPRNKNSFTIQMDNVPNLRRKLNYFSLDYDKGERAFPLHIIKAENMSHFIRGFFDSNARISLKDRKIEEIIFTYNPDFLKFLSVEIQKLTGIVSEYRKGNVLVYGSNDIDYKTKQLISKREVFEKLYDMLYNKDRELIISREIYLPSKKARFINYS